MKIGICVRGADFDKLIPNIREIIGDSGVEISGIGLYCNP